MKFIVPISLVACLILSGTASAASISGKTAAKSTVVALSKDGRSWSAKADSKGRFSIKSTAKAVTLQLRDKLGRYAGPVVVGGTASKAITGVRNGAALGTLKISRGAARPVKTLAKKYVDTSFFGKAVKGVPVGAGKLGFGGGTVVKSSQAFAAGPLATPSGPASELSKPGADPDQDGVPNAIDVDDNGNKVVDAADPAMANVRPGGIRSFTQIFLGLSETVNVDASPDSAALINAKMRQRLSFVLLDVPANTALDCGGLTWCSAGGTGHMEGAGPDIIGAPFPNGGNSIMPLNSQKEFRLLPGAGVDEIRAGDTLIEKRADGTQMTGGVGFVFATVPAVHKWTLSTGQSETVSYPAAASSPGTQSNPISIRPGPDGHRKLTLEFWRPQRHAIAGAEADGFIDIGHLMYQMNVPMAGVNGPTCPNSSVTTTSPELTAGSGPGPSGFADSSADAPSNTSRLLNLTVDLDACAAARGKTLTDGEEIPFDLAANAPSTSSVDHANQTIRLRVAPAAG